MVADGREGAERCRTLAARAAGDDAVCRVLVVDDDLLVLEGTVGMVEDLGHVVFKTSSAREALTMLRAGTLVDLVVTD